MSLFGALNTAVSGLSAQAAAFSNIGDNVANSQTVGFKRIDTSFEDYLTTSTPSVNESGAVVARPDYVNSVQGSVTQTDHPLDLAIAGQGFFTVSQQVGDVKGQAVFSPQLSYTRAGDFTLNKDGYLVNSAGLTLNGYIQDATQAPGTLDQTQIKPIQIGQTLFSPVATSNVVLSANLPSTPTGTGPITSQVQVYDALGQNQTLQLSYAQVTGTPNTWKITVTQPGGTTLGTVDVAFGPPSGQTSPPSGTLRSVSNPTGSLTGSPYTLNGPANVGLTADFGSGNQPITLNLGNFGQANGLTQFAGDSYSLRALTQNGVGPGHFSSVATKSNGDVVVNFDNGQSRTVANVPVTTFVNPDALQRINGQAFTATRDSGAPQTLQPGANGAGQLVTSSLESSNVDIGKEFTKLIVAQRAYSANTKLVTTADNLLQETLDMKR